jgi:hypothetical protein
MPRPKGSPNKSARELEAEAKRLAEKARLLRRLKKIREAGR